MAINERDKTLQARPGDKVTCWIHGPDQVLVLVTDIPPEPTGQPMALPLECEKCFAEISEACGFPTWIDRTSDRTPSPSTAVADASVGWLRRRIRRFLSARKSGAWNGDFLSVQ